MATRDNHPPTTMTHSTTNEEDQREVAKLQARLKSCSKRRSGQTSDHCVGNRLPSVEIAEGAFKYVLIKAALDGEDQFIVTSKRGAAYHRNAAEPMIAKLEQAGYSDIEVTGGGRILLDEDAKKISIFGFSYGFGPANHAISRQVVMDDARYQDYEVTISDEGY